MRPTSLLHCRFCRSRDPKQCAYLPCSHWWGWLCSGVLGNNIQSSLHHHYWHLGQIISSSLFISITGLYPLVCTYNPTCDNCKYLQTSPNVPPGTKFTPFENHSSIRMDGGEIVLEGAVNRRYWKFAGRLTVFGSYNNIIWVLKLKSQFGMW